MHVADPVKGQLTKIVISFEEAYVGLSFPSYFQCSRPETKHMRLNFALFGNFVYNAFRSDEWHNLLVYQFESKVPSITRIWALFQFSPAL